MHGQSGYEFLEHTADAYIAAYGKDLSEAFENAATALFEVMTDVGRINPESRDDVQVEGEDEYALLYVWLEALIVRSEVNRMLYCKFKISEIDRLPNDFRLRAQIWGERFDAKKHTQKVGVKAVTYHRMEIIKKPEKVTLKFILDI
jgi:SHS2 domain-containing protein